MAYRTIEQIKIGGNPNGQVWGGFIFSANMSVGYDTAVTQLILSVISTSNNYTISDSDLKVNSAPTLIKIGDLKINMFPYAYTKTRSAEGGTILNVTYVDQSINLDRVFIGLANEHTRKNIKTVVLAGSVPMVCEACDGSTTARPITATINRQVDSYGLILPASTTAPFTGEIVLGQNGVKQSVFHYGQGSSSVPALIITVNGTAGVVTEPTGSNLTAPTAPTISGFTVISSLTTTRLITYFGWSPVPNGTNNPAFSFGSIREGGLIALGTEEFSQSTCSSGSMTYSLKELKAAIKNQPFNFTIETIETAPGVFTDSIPDGYDDLRRNYSGTLRSVLQNWGNDYGFSFSYDFESNKLIGINLRNPVADIEVIKNRIKNADSLNSYTGSPVIETLEESASLAGTYRKYHSTIYRKDTKIRSYSKTIYNQARFSPLRLQDIMSLAGTGYTDYDELYISCILATVSKNLWLYYNIETISTFAKIAMNSEGFKGVLAKRVGSVPDSSNTTGHAEFFQLTAANYKDYIEMVYSTQKTIAENFLNQHYINFQYTPVKNKYCAGNFLDIDFSAQFSDNVETFYKSNGTFPNSLPNYSSIMKGVYGSNIYPVSRVVTNYLGFYGVLTVNAVNFLSRQGKYLETYSAAQLNATNSSLFGNIGINANPNNPVEEVKNLVQYLSVKANSVSITLDADRVNSRESQAIAVPSSNNSCKLYCEEDFVSEICDFNKCLGPGQRSDQEWPKGLVAVNNQVFGDTLRVSFNSTSPAVNPNSVLFYITTPSYAPYQTNFVYQFNNRYVMPGSRKVLSGEIDASRPGQGDYPQNVEAVDFSTADVTSDIDTYFDSTSNQVVTNLLTPNNGLMTVENYDTELRNTALVTASVSNLRKTFRFSVPGMLDATFSDILTPAKGLLSFDISYDEKGLTTTYSYATRPPKPPQRETVFNRISPSFARR